MVKANFRIDLPESDIDVSCEVVNPFGDRQQMEHLLSTFCQLYAQRPFDNTGGVLFSSAFAYFCFLQRIKPNLVIESGIWRGFSTWLIDSMLPDATLYCLDPVLMMPLEFEATYRPSRAFYSTQDFSCIRFSFADATKTCVIFDDHQNVVPRLEQAANYGIQHIILDDNQYEPTYHESITHLIKQAHPVLPYLFQSVAEYYLFPPLVPPVPEGCPLAPLWEEVPECLQALKLNLAAELVYSWVTYLRLS